MSAAPDIKSQIAELFAIAAKQVVPDANNLSIQLERPKQVAHGDYSCNLAMQLAKSLKKNPRELAQALLAALPASPLVEKAEIAGAGFINIFLKASAKQQVVKQIFSLGEKFGISNHGRGEKVQVEFVSANPTGPLHVGHGRGAAIGDSLSRLLQANGWNVTREFYYNDAGAQIANLGLSVQARLREMSGGDAPFPENGYQGEYIKDIAAHYKKEFSQDTKNENLDAMTKLAVRELRKEQDLDLRAFDVAFESYFLESSLYSDGSVQKTVDMLVSNGVTYEQDGALWLKTTPYGDDKDRVMRKSDGSFTYFVPDVAYHVSKWQRGFTRVVNEQGSDHHSTVTRVRAGLQALDIGIPKGYPDYVLHQMVTVMRGGEEVKISKRAGSYVTLRDLIDEVGRDATRYFFVMRKSDTHLVFDIDLAREQTENNPVYYIQYAHARVCRVLEQWGGEVKTLHDVDLAPLDNAYERDLLQALIDYPELVKNAAEELSPHLVAFYLKELAGKLHTYYNAERFLVDDDQLKLARLALIAVTRTVLHNGLALLGVSAPEKM
ncbi:MAG: arginine--tRNA ligase [Pseudomonadota bacterium]|jgi:arginyl-tRNA synthetase